MTLMGGIRTRAAATKTWLVGQTLGRSRVATGIRSIGALRTYSVVEDTSLMPGPEQVAPPHTHFLRPVTGDEYALIFLARLLQRRALRSGTKVGMSRPI